MSIDSKRLASVIFDGGQKITQQQYSAMCSLIESDVFTLNSYVVKYKLKESFLSKVAFRLNDGTSVLISESFVNRLNTLNIETEQLEAYMVESYANFKQVSGILNGNQ